MSILCALGGHEAATSETYNSGYYFSRCRRCGRDMIRAGASWATVPSGHRVVWRGGGGCHSLEPNYGPHLPVLHHEANLPALRPPYASWSRQLMRTQGKGRSSATPAAAAEESNQYPALLALAALAAAAVHMLLGFGSRSGGQW